MIMIRVTMCVIVEKQKEVMQTLLSMIEPTGREKGCLSYRVFRDIEHQNVFCILEEWKTRKDLDHHIKSDRFGILLGTGSLLSKPMSMQIDTISGSEGMEMIKKLRSKNTLIYTKLMPEGGF